MELTLKERLRAIDIIMSRYNKRDIIVLLTDEQMYELVEQWMEVTDTTAS